MDNTGMPLLGFGAEKFFLYDFYPIKGYLRKLHIRLIDMRVLFLSSRYAVHTHLLFKARNLGTARTLTLYVLPRLVDHALIEMRKSAKHHTYIHITDRGREVMANALRLMEAFYTSDLDPNEMRKEAFDGDFSRFIKE